MFVPENEQGVVAMFMRMADVAGWNLLKIGAAYPDAVFEHKGDEWRVEFEFNSSNFVTHGHDIRGCDAIVCFLNDYSDCPLPVVCIGDNDWMGKSYVKAHPKDIETEYWKRRAYVAEGKLSRINNVVANSSNGNSEITSAFSLTELESARDILTGFVIHMFNSVESGSLTIRPNGVFVKGVSLPWTKRGEDIHGASVSTLSRKMIRSIIAEASPRIFAYNSLIKAWQANLSYYANCSDMLESIDKSVDSLKKRVVSVIVGEEEGV